RGKTLGPPEGGHYRRAIRAALTREESFSLSVHASSASFFATTIRGNRVPDIAATATLGPRAPDASMRRTLNVGFSSATSTQPTIAAPSVVSATCMRPSVPASSTRVALPNVRPPPCENATYDCGFSLGAVNHATTTSLPLAAIDGPLIGHASILKLSAWTRIGIDHFAPARR